MPRKCTDRRALKTAEAGGQPGELPGSQMASPESSMMTSAATTAQ